MSLCLMLVDKVVQMFMNHLLPRNTRSVCFTYNKNKGQKNSIQLPYHYSLQEHALSFTFSKLTSFHTV